MAFRWYVVHTYSGFENRVKISLQERVAAAGMEEFFPDVLIPEEDVVELVSGEKKTSKRKFFPGYILVRMELNDETWKRLHEVSASSYVQKGLAPYLLIHGDKDQTVPYEQSVRFQQQMKASGNQCDLITIPGSAHGMGGWDKLNSDYKEQLVAWLKTTLK